MANDKENYKEGVDFEFRTVTGKDGKPLYKNRHFFTRAEKDVMKAPKAAPKATPKATAPKVKPKASSTSSVQKARPKPAIGVKAAAGSNVGTRKSTGAKVTGEQRMPVPGAAIGRAIRNAFTGRGETDAAKISASGGGTLKLSAPVKAKPKLRTTSTRNSNFGGQYATVGYAKGGTVKKKAC